MADETKAAFAIELKDGVSGPALDAQQAIAKLRDDINKDTKALAEMQRAMKRLQGGTSVNVEQFRKLDGQIKAAKQRIADATGALVDLGGSLESVKRPSTGLAAALERLQEKTKGVGGPVEGFIGKLGSLKGLLSAKGVMVLGAIALAAALIAVSAATVMATKATLAYGIAQADARRTELLRLEGLTKIRSIWGLAAGNAKEMQAAIDHAAASTALGRDEIGKYATQLYRAGLRGENFNRALEATALKAAVQGDAMAEAWAGTAASIALSGGSVKKFADNVKARLGGIAAKQMLSLDVQSKKLRENLSMLFSGLKIEGFLAALKTVGDLFSQSTVSGRALKSLVQVIFQPMIAAIDYLAPIAKRFFQGLMLGAQDVVIAVLKTALWVKKAFGIEFPKNIGDAKAALVLGKVALYGLAAALAFTTAAAAALGVALLPVLWSGVAALWGMVAAGAAMAAPFVLAAVAVVAVGAALYQLYQLWKEIDWKGLGKAICEGIVSGLKAGAKWVLDAISWLADKTWGTFKKTLGIASPSKEFAKLGVQLPAGVEQGIEQGQPELDRSVDGMVTPPAAAPGPSAALARGGDRSLSVTIENLTIQTQATDAKGIARDLRTELEALLSTLLVQTGVPA